MFTSMEVLTSQGNLLTLQLVDDSSGITVQGIDGLDPGKSTLVSSNYAGQDGAIYQGATFPPRNITMLLGLEPDPAVNTVRSLRDTVYSFFRPKTSITLTFNDDEVSHAFVIAGVVESTEFEAFSQLPVIGISVMCYDPDFQDPTPVVVSGMTTADVAATAVVYAGTSDTGMVITVSPNRTMSGFSLYYIDPTNTTYTLDFLLALSSGDVVTISTVPGNKYATLLRSGSVSSVTYAVSPLSTWPKFTPGNNSLRFSATGAAVPASVTYTKRFEAF